jgi:hypothetical protein
MLKLLGLLAISVALFVASVVSAIRGDRADVRAEIASSENRADAYSRYVRNGMRDAPRFRVTYIVVSTEGFRRMAASRAWRIIPTPVGRRLRTDKPPIQLKASTVARTLPARDADLRTAIEAGYVRHASTWVVGLLVKEATDVSVSRLTLEAERLNAIGYPHVRDATDLLPYGSDSIFVQAGRKAVTRMPISWRPQSPESHSGGDFVPLAITNRYAYGEGPLTAQLLAENDNVPGFEVANGIVLTAQTLVASTPTGSSSRLRLRSVLDQPLILNVSPAPK